MNFENTGIGEEEEISFENVKATSIYHKKEVAF